MLNGSGRDEKNGEDERRDDEEGNYLLNAMGRWTREENDIYNNRAFYAIAKLLSEKYSKCPNRTSKTIPQPFMSFYLMPLRFGQY